MRQRTAFIALVLGWCLCAWAQLDKEHRMPPVLITTGSCSQEHTCNEMSLLPLILQYSCDWTSSSVDCKDVGNGQCEFDALSKIDPDDSTVFFLKDIVQVDGVTIDPVTGESLVAFRGTKLRQEVRNSEFYRFCNVRRCSHESVT